MSDTVLLGSAVVNAVASATSVPAYYGLVPQGSAFPAITVNRQDAFDEYTFDSHTVNADYLVKALSNRNYPYEAAAIYDTVHSGINNKQLVVTGFQALRFLRTTTVEYRDTEGYWHVGGIYRVVVHQD